jgi:hypothetical protein
MIYFPTGKSTSLNLTSMKTSELQLTWYDPRTGVSFPGDNTSNSSEVIVTPPSSGNGNDWVLVIDDPRLSFPAPGIIE